MHHAAVRKHRHLVRERGDLADAMRDHQDGEPRRGKHLDARQERASLLVGQRRRRLVEDEEAIATFDVVQSDRQVHEGTLGRREAAGEHLGVEIDAEAIEQRSDASFEFAPTDMVQSACGIATE